MYLLVQDQKCTLWIRSKDAYINSTTAKQYFDLGCRSIADAKPNHFGRVTKKKTTLMEVGVLCHNGKTLLHGISPDDCICRLL